MTADLDTMLHAASDSLHVAVDGLPAGDAPRPSPVPRLVAAAVLVAALVVGGALVLRHRHHDGTTSDIPAGPDDIPRLVIGEDARGLRAAGAVDLPLPADSQEGIGTITLYGDAGAADPFVDRDLMVVVLGAGGSGPTTGDSVTVRGKPATLATGDTAGATSLSWKETSDQAITLGSSTLGRDQLLAIAEGLRIDGRRVTLGPLPPGVDGRLSRIGHDVALDLSLVPVFPVSSPGHATAYQAGDRFTTVVTYAGDAGDLAVARYLGSADRPVEVRGHRGWIGVAHQGGGVEVRTVVWEEAPGVIGVLQGGEDEATMLAVAAGLRTPSDAEWRALVDMPGTQDSGSSEGSGSTSGAVATIPGAGASAHDVYASGAYPGGTWDLYDEAGQLCLSSTTGDRGSAVCGDPRVAVQALSDNGGDTVMVFGVLPAGAEGAEVAGALGSVEVHGLPDGRRVYVAPVDPADVPDHVTLVDGEGRAVDTLAVDG